MRKAVRWKAAILAAVVAGSFGGTARAHCRPGTAGSLVGLVSTCPYNDQIETITGAASSASNGMLVHVFVKDQTFHPEVVHVRSGGTVVFHYLDIDRNENHDPGSSGGCVGGAGNLNLADPSTCVPASPANCFDVLVGQGAMLKSPGDTYPVTFTYTPATGRVTVARGVLAGTPVIGGPPFANVPRNCPLSTAYPSGTSGLIPFRCGVHGSATSSVTIMRGVIVVDP